MDSRVRISDKHGVIITVRMRDSFQLTVTLAGRLEIAAHLEKNGS